MRYSVVVTLAAILVFTTTATKASDCIQQGGDMTGVTYRGTLAVTKSGRSCQKWAAQSPNRHKFTAGRSRFPNYNGGLDENFCRNPSGHTGIWCYNGEGTFPRWEDCVMPPPCWVFYSRPDNRIGTTTCSGVDINGMGCSCLANYYNMRDCGSGLSYDPQRCATYNHHCLKLKSGKKKEKTCCRAILCFGNKLNC
ncbi:plasminogen-like [Bolinopsis microptera]|uniref:plasminogen-like n=1 Tax=Bolinopsis microptera TaxID=2820187 RepID=UPI0030797251